MAIQTDLESRQNQLEIAYDESMEVKSLKEFYEVLENFNWFYAFSTDNRIWDVGREALKRIKEIAKTIEGGDDLYRRYHDYVFSGPEWDRERKIKKKPERPSV